MKQKPILYGAPLSPFVRKVAIFLEEKGILYDWQMVRPHDRNSPEFLRISPLGKIPAYKDEQVELPDSSVICAYLEKTQPTPALYPANPVDYAKALWLEEYFDGAMVQPMGAIYFQKYGYPVLSNKPTDEAKLKEAEEKLPPMLAYVESQLRIGKWAVGEELSIADITLAVGFVNLALAGYTLDAATYPKLHAHVARMSARPSFVKIAEFTEAFIAKLTAKPAAP